MHLNEFFHRVTKNLLDHLDLAQNSPKKLEYVNKKPNIPFFKYFPTLHVQRIFQK